MASGEGLGTAKAVAIVGGWLALMALWGVLDTLAQERKRGYPYAGVEKFLKAAAVALLAAVAAAATEIFL